MNIPRTGWKNIREAMHGLQEPENARILAEYYWRALLIAAFVAGLLSVGYGFWELSAVSSVLNNENQTGTVPQPALDRGKLDATVAGFSARASRYEGLKGQSPSIADPSQ